MLKNLNVKQLADIVEGHIINHHEKHQISQIAIDSRQVLHANKTAFVTLKGAKTDGTKFIPALIEQGVAVFIVAHDFIIEGYAASSFIQVADCKKALQKIAVHQRNFFTSPMVGITGSNGKTIVKEWLGQVLGQNYAVAKSPKSYNSQVGVPLSIFGIEPYHQVAILEAGVSKAGEMDTLADIIKPNVGIFTTLGTAHQEGFDTVEAKLLEKLKLFATTDFLIYCKDQELVSNLIEESFPPSRLVGWSDMAGADFVRSLKIGEKESRIILIKADLNTFTFNVPLTDSASLENITHVIVSALTLGQTAESIQQGISHLKSVDMRLTLKSGLRDCLLIDDTYNNDLGGLRVALDFMQQQRLKRRKILILSDLLQQGPRDEVYDVVEELIRLYQIDYIIGVGTEIQYLEKSFGGQFESYRSTDDLLKNINLESFSNDLILITGARVFEFEKIVNKLQQQIHGTTLEINLNGLTHNYNFYKKLLFPDTKVMVMVKAFAYGGGAVEIANHIQTMGADYLAVAFTDEGVALRKQGIQLPIMVLNAMEESFALCDEYKLEPVVYSLDFLESLILWTVHHNSEMSIHLDMDTGMHRLGFESEELDQLIAILVQNPQLRIASIYTHLVGADEEIHRDFSLTQLSVFTQMKDKILKALPYRPLIHALNSAGIVAYPAYQFDMVRLGIGLYGVEVTGKHEGSLRSISTLKTTVSQVKTLNAGETVGYSRVGKLDKRSKIATLAIGYADGYDRRFSNGKGYVLIHGKPANIIGNVCMDMCMVDVSDIDVKPGDTAVIYGEGISLKELADRIETIPYELLTNISTRVKRVYYLD